MGLYIHIVRGNGGGVELIIEEEMVSISQTGSRKGR